MLFVLCLPFYFCLVFTSGLHLDFLLRVNKAKDRGDMANHSTDFLRFSAYSIKDLITRKLQEDTKLTDQIYEGSNASILIDLISYMY